MNQSKSRLWLDLPRPVDVEGQNIQTFIYIFIRLYIHIYIYIRSIWLRFKIDILRCRIRLDASPYNLSFEEGKFFVPKDKCLQYDIPWESACPDAHSFSDLQRYNDLWKVWLKINPKNFKLISLEPLTLLDVVDLQRPF